MKEPYLSSMLDKTIRNLEGLIPQMVSFMDSEIDQHPWEKWANAEYISNNEMEVDLMALVRDILGHASVPSLFGREFLDNNPHVLHDIYEMDRGMMYFIMGLPWFTPWPAVARAHYSRSQIQQSMTKFQEALDASVDGKQMDSSWGDLDDVSDFILKRHELFRSKITENFIRITTDIVVEHGLNPNERGDISVRSHLFRLSSHYLTLSLGYLGSHSKLYTHSLLAPPLHPLHPRARRQNPRRDLPLCNCNPWRENWLYFRSSTHPPLSRRSIQEMSPFQIHLSRSLTIIFPARISS